MGKSVFLEGQITARERVVVQGKFKGRIESKEHEVVVDEKASVEGDIIAAGVSVSGTVVGSIVGLKRAKFTSTATMNGKLTTTREFLVEKGAIFRGQVEYRTQDD